MTTLIHPILLAKGEVASADYLPALERSLRSAQGFYEQYGVYAAFGTIWRPKREHSVDLSLPNPWLAVWELVARMWLNELPAGHKFLVFLLGWRDPNYLGWGGGNLAVVGDLLVDYLTTPDVWDDNMATGVIAHEIGHALGLAHLPNVEDNIMWQWWKYPHVRLAQRPPDAARLASVRTVQEVEGCPIMTQ